MINNRQNGRRRGRGGGPRSPNQGPNPGNRQDNRSRGNAAQLLEKYKALARDAQMGGDRVQTEYWLQFADHYYRVLNENRARFEEQRPRRDDYSDEDEGEESGVNAAADGDESDGRYDRDDREDRGERQDRGYRDRGDRPERPERPRREFRAERNGEPRPERRPRDERRDRDDEPAERGERISLEVLPPAITVVEGDAPAKAPRRRTRRPRDEDGEEIAPAA
ncbi:MAG: hypothetical protein QOG84_2927 [Sphingomonadales bacterium]|nr:hypothetical protein [Sphingomonadales bacterium]